MLAGTKTGKNFHYNWQKFNLHFFIFYCIFMIYF
nr:MAG TPA: hypothetical protein [Caudoviricetes sp.]